MTRRNRVAMWSFVAAGLGAAGVQVSSSVPGSEAGRSVGAEVVRSADATSLKFLVRLPEVNASGRLFVALARDGRPEPRDQIGSLGQLGEEGLVVLARDIPVDSDRQVTLDRTAFSDPIASLDELPRARYHVQAVWDVNHDSARLDAPGNRYSQVITIDLDPARGETHAIDLDQVIGPEELPADTAQVRFLKIPSPSLSAFHGRPMYLRAGVILPRGFEEQPDRHYPLRVHIGGFATPCTAVKWMMQPQTRFAQVWNGADTPRFVLLHLDGDGPLGDPYQVNSANHGPYGDALMQELLPEVERRFRCGGSGSQRVTDGGSTGGWVSFALQVFHPDAFAGCWSFCPDPVDFRSYQRINIYEQRNAYQDPEGGDVPSARDPRTGQTQFTVRQECRMENMLGLGDRYTTSGGQWGAWNATFSPRGADGTPAPLWDPGSGAIDPAIAQQWKAFDLRHRLEHDWPEIGPLLRGKIHIWVGEADDFFLDQAVRRLDAFLSRALPPYEGSITYGPGEGHCWMGIDEAAMLDQMARAVNPPARP